MSSAKAPGGNETPEEKQARLAQEKKEGKKDYPKGDIECFLTGGRGIIKINGKLLTVVVKRFTNDSGRVTEIVQLFKEGNSPDREPETNLIL